MHTSPMEYKILPPKKRKLDRCILEENGTMYRSSEQGNTHCDSLPEINSFAPKTVHGVHRSQSQQLKIQSGEVSIKLDGTSLVLDAVGEQGNYSTIGRRASDFNENPHPESAQYRKSYVANKSCYPDTALVKTSQRGSQDTDAACESITKLLNASVAYSSDTKVFGNHHTLLMKGSDEDIDEFDCPSMPSHKAAPVASQKIWEGSIQFYPNTSVPILAFFKSGQKLFDISWSALVAIKGKITLEDFEKYIKGLPRSRTRNLMVISLCWKPGSSRAGLEWLKEVVKRYEMNKQVALAQPSPDVSLYLYPWDEVITTPLVKCGYLEEKAVIADRSELLIGCVVWRRKQMPSISMTYQSENRGAKLLKEQEVWSPLRSEQGFKGHPLGTAPTCAISSKAEYSASCSDLHRTTTFSKVEERAVGDFNSSPDFHFWNEEVTTRPPNNVATSSSDLVVSDPPALSFGKFICERCGKRNLSVGNDKDIPGLILPMLELSSAEKKEPSPASHSEFFKTSSRDLPVNCPGQPIPSKFPISLDSSHEPKRFNGTPPLRKLPRPVPNQHNSLSRQFTFLRNLGRPSGVPDVDHPSAN